MLLFTQYQEKYKQKHMDQLGLQQYCTFVISSMMCWMWSVTRGSLVGGKHWSSVISRRNSLINRLLKLVTVSPRSFARLIIWPKRRKYVYLSFGQKILGKKDNMTCSIAENENNYFVILVSAVWTMRTKRSDVWWGK